MLNGGIVHPGIGQVLLIQHSTTFFIFYPER